MIRQPKGEAYVSEGMAPTTFTAKCPCGWHGDDQLLYANAVKDRDRHVCPKVTQTTKGRVPKIGDVVLVVKSVVHHDEVGNTGTVLQDRRSRWARFEVHMLQYPFLKWNFNLGDIEVVDD